MGRPLLEGKSSVADALIEAMVASSSSAVVDDADSDGSGHGSGVVGHAGRAPMTDGSPARFAGVPASMVPGELHALHTGAGRGVASRSDRSTVLELQQDVQGAHPCELHAAARAAAQAAAEEAAQVTTRIEGVQRVPPG